MKAGTMRPATDTRGLAALLLGAACIGIAPVWVRWSEVGPVATAFHRLALALPFLALWAVRERSGVPGNPLPDHHIPGAFQSPSGRLLAWTLVGGACFAIDLAAWHLSIQLTSVANATLLANFAPIFVTLGAWIFLKERAHTRFFLAMLIALAGAWMLTGASLRADPSRLRGDLLALVTALFYGGYQLCVARLRRSLPTARSLFWTSMVCTPLLGLFAVASGETLWPPTPRAWLILIALALTAQVLGQGLITYGFAHLPAAYSSLTLLLQPLVATLAGWWIFGESLTPIQATGALVLLAGLFLARRRGSPAPQGDSR